MPTLWKIDRSFGVWVFQGLLLVAMQCDLWGFCVGMCGGNSIGALKMSRS